MKFEEMVRELRLVKTQAEKIKKLESDLAMVRKLNKEERKTIQWLNDLLDKIEKETGKEICFVCEKVHDGSGCDCEPEQ